MDKSVKTVESLRTLGLPVLAVIPHIQEPDETRNEIEEFMLRIKKKDKVQVIAGREKGKTGEVLKVDHKKGRLVVAKLNLVTKHKRPTQTDPGGRNQIETAMPLSKAMLVCPKCDQPIRPKFDKLQSGEKVRLCRKCGEVIL